MPSEIEDLYPLSPTQEAMLFVSAQSAANDTYFQQGRFHYRGRLNTAAFRQAWQEVVDRHPVLRTNFIYKRRESPLQAVRRQMRLPITEHDWRTFDDAEQRSRLEELCAADRARGFDLSTEPLMRLHLVRLADDRHCVVWSHHHLILDGWSIGLVLGEAAERYAAGCRGGRLELPRPRPYRDYLSWLRDRDTAVEEAFWRESLAGLEGPTSLPHVSPPAGPRQEAVEELTVGEVETAALRRAASGMKITLGSLLHGAWALLLSRYTNQTDVVFGITSSGRPAELAGVEDMLGVFFGTLPFRIRAAPDQPVERWLRHVQDRAVRTRRFEHVSPAALREHADVPGGVPLFQSVQVVQNTAKDEALWRGFGDLEVESVDYFVRTDDPMTVLTVPQRELMLRLNYDAGCLDRAAAARLLAHYRTLVGELAAHPERAVGAVPILTAPEREAITRWNATKAPLDERTPVHRVFEDLAGRTPEAVALEHGARTLTYRELDCRANRIANALRERGVGTDTVVGLCLPRSFDLIAAMLGTLKAGGAFLSMDPAYPRARLAMLIEDARPALVASTREVADALPDGASVLLLDTTEEWPATRPDVTAEPRDLAYLIYTSGSTGRPKGVMVEHLGLRNVIERHHELFGLGPVDVVLQFCSTSFDVSVLEIMLALTCGARLCLADPDRLIPGQGLIDLMNEHGVTFVSVTPSAFDALPRDADVPSLHTVSVIGEKCSADLVRRFAPGRRFFNLYGPAEVSIVSTVARCEPADAAPSIGRPIGNVTAYVLAEGGEPQPAGAVGELYLGGIGLARGYHDRPELTAERFLPDPFSADPRARLYRTGDLAVRRPDGELEFVGRVDHQVKVRGFRVEPAEIEEAIRLHPDVARTVVAAHGEGSERSLVAYVVPGPPRSADDPGARGEAGDERTEQVEQWRNIYQRTYEGSADDGAFDTVGWHSSYSGERIPREQMEEWAELTLSRIRSLAPRRVLDIGCGNGLMLFPLADECEEIWGTDVAESGLDHVRRELGRRPRGAQVTLLRRSADDFSDLPDGHFDVVVLNSVAQYFPDLDYLRRVLVNAARTLRRGGHLFVGDVRNLDLLEEMHLSVRMASAAEDQTSASIWARALHDVRMDQELVVHPAFFRLPAAEMGRDCSVRLLAKRGRHRNEMTLFRYDVMLELDTVPTQGDGTVTWLDHRADGRAASVAGLLERRGAEVMVVRDLPDVRVSGLLATARQLRDGSAPARVGELRRPVNEPDDADVDELAATAARLGYDAEFLLGDEPGSLTAVFVRHGAEAPSTYQVCRAVEAARPERPPEREANDPLLQRRGSRLIAELRGRLAAVLPPYMVPSSFVLLDSLPVNSSGKIDRSRLQGPAERPPVRAGEFVPPRDATEIQVAQAWEDVLGYAPIGTRENFFHIGGHSLLAMRVISRLQRRFNRELDLSVLFERPTIEQMAAALRDEARDAGRSPLVVLAPGEEAPPLFLVHPAGGNTLAYHELVKRLGPERPCYGLEALDVDGPEAIGQMAARYIDMIREVQEHGPYQLAGWSFGGVVAYEMARRLREQAEDVGLLALFDSSLPRPAPGVSEREMSARRFRRFVHYLSTNFRKPMHVSYEELLRHDEGGQLALVMAAGAECGLLAGDIGADIFRRLHATYLRSIDALHGYTPPPSEVRFWLYRATEPLPEELRDLHFDRDEEALGWESVCPGQIDVVPVPGNHLSLLSSPHVEILAEHLGRLLAPPVTKAAGKAMRS